MNKDEISNMPAGREMDALVAEYVMGWETISFESEIIPNHIVSGWNDEKRKEIVRSCYWQPSEDISAAWDVLAKLNLTDFCIEKVGEHYCVNLTVESACGETAPLAICRACLLAVVPANIGGV